tara:strand:+ start:4503 stop:5105 length:603 start_codon:yes stop_codon:yes gene_type:complete
MAMHAERFEGYRTRHEDGTAPRAVAAFNLFQTPEALALRMVELADIHPQHSVLEPSAGLGRLLKPILERNPSHVTACEISPDCCGELFAQFPSVDLLQRDFLTVEPPREGNCGIIIKKTPKVFYDRIIMNPPFKLRRDIKHIEHALRFLAPGGKLVGLCFSAYKRREFLESLNATIEIIPEKTFKAEGTQVETLLFTITN